MYRFVGGCEFDVTSGEVRRSGAVTRLEPQPASVLALLASRPGELVTHDEIRHAVWGGDTHVNFQDSVHYCIRQIRAALVDQARESRVIETIPKRGYRLRADAVFVPTPVPQPVSSGSRAIGRRQRLMLACVVSAVATAAVIVEQRPNSHHQITVAVLKTIHDMVF